MTYEVVYTMSRVATPEEWDAATTLVRAWLDLCARHAPAWFEAADVRVSSEALIVELAGAEDLVVERAATTPIWSVRTPSPDAARVLAGVLLCLQFACGARTLQLSGSTSVAWQAAARALAPVWQGEYVARTLTPRRVKADTLVYVDHGENGRQLRDYVRAQLELDETTLPDRDFRDRLADS